MTEKNKKTKTRKAPPESATTVAEGTIKQLWVVKKTLAGVRRWVPVQNAVLHNYRMLTMSYIKKHLNQPMMIYCRDYKSVWPMKKSEFDYVFTFTATGDATVKKKQLQGWLKSKANVNCKMIHGTGDFDRLHVHHGMVTTNVFSKECFVFDTS
jgi:hypothetical protein